MLPKIVESKLALEFIPRFTSTWSPTISTNKDPMEIIIFISADCDQVKHYFIDKINHYFSLPVNQLVQNQTIAVKTLFVATKMIYHGKHIHEIQNLTHNDGYIDLVLDWYCLTLSRIMLTWRKAYVPSTFAFSAQRMSGTLERTNRVTGKGIGTMGYFVNRHRHSGALYFVSFFMPGFLEDYAMPGDP